MIEDNLEIVTGSRTDWLSGITNSPASARAKSDKGVPVSVLVLQSYARDLYTCTERYASVTRI